MGTEAPTVLSGQASSLSTEVEGDGTTQPRPNNDGAPDSWRSFSSFNAKANQWHQGLSWSGVNMEVVDKRGNVQKQILQDVWGSANPGETTAILGASGAGKTSLFNILTGRVRSKPGKLSIRQDIRMGGVQVEPGHDRKVRNLFALVSQEDTLHHMSTPREAIWFSARLRLPKETSQQAIEQLVQNNIDELGLQHCADTIIGGGLKKGISGGEKRRTTIGVELVSRPSTIFLDEPTSGLDSVSAKHVMALLKRVAQANTTVIFTIHQPSSDIFASFDRLLLLKQGRLMYQGATADVGEDFADRGFPLPPNYNPADWVLEVSEDNQLGELRKAGFFPPPPEVPKPSDNEIEYPRARHAGMLMELQMLLERERRNYARNPARVGFTIVATGFLAFVAGAIFFQTGSDEREDLLVLQSQLGALVNILISAMMGQASTAVMIFNEERGLFLREYATGHYSILPYFLTQFLSEAFMNMIASMTQSLIVYFMIGFRQRFWELLSVNFTLSMSVSALAVWLGALFSDPRTAQAMFTPCLVPQFYFSGVFIPINSVHRGVRWIQWICTLTYASRLSLVYEFGDCDSDLCSDFAEQNNINANESWWYWLALLALFFLFRAVALYTVRSRALNPSA
mmetsp:Transcript_7542/g.14715  ORF Transcript_7542/g.14715 Transcript_7542/m.14715 type:complete len:626 (+) Transcript_7542:250-2127(+)